MESFNPKKIIKNLEFGKGLIKNRTDAKDYINLGYNPNRLLLHFKVIDNNALQYILSQIENDKLKNN